jgi:two-component system response regulator RegA
MSGNPRLLLVDDDEAFTRTAARVMARRGFEPLVANDTAAALQLADATLPYAVVDLMIGNESGLKLVPQLRALNPAMRILVLTGYASISTAVDAIKLGADNYLAKPVDASTIIAALDGSVGMGKDDAGSGPPHAALSIGRLEWEHIQRVLKENAGNISATARVLKMHRRTLQRKLSKRPAK